MSVLSLIASIIGVVALTFVAKGNVFGQILTVAFSVFYGIISFEQQYYGEMITYLGMTAPIALMSVFSWLKNPYKKGKSEVAVAKMNRNQVVKMFILSIIVSIVFYFILRFFNNASLILSTLSVTTSFIASYLMFKRNPFYAIAYALNDIVLISLWIIATMKSGEYLTMVICFSTFLLNDIYGYYNWCKMAKRQK